VLTGKRGLSWDGAFARASVLCPEYGLPFLRADLARASIGDNFVMNISGGTTNPIAFQRAMVFVDGTNLLERLKAAKLRLLTLKKFCHGIVGARQIVRIYFYTTEPYFEESRKRHDSHAFDGVRLVFGDLVPREGSTPKEKGVDALLVADLIYHAASKNFYHAYLLRTLVAEPLSLVSRLRSRSALSMPAMMSYPSTKGS
jgi:hypothetical protein